MPAPILLLGHRGAREYAPENTFSAFELALEHGAHGFEFDVRGTRDRQTIICHDPKVLERYRGSAFLNIEVKVRGLEELVARAVKRVRPQRYFISSFLPSVVRKLHSLDHSLVLGALAQTRWQLRRWRILPVKYVVPHYRLLSRRLVDKLHAANKTVITWTVNDRRKMLRAVEWGVDGIISDDTQLLVQTLGGRASL